MTVDHDPTMQLYNALNRANPSEWGRVIYGTPIFVEHDGWEVEDGVDDKGKPKKRLVVVPKGENPPENGRLLYSVDRERLEQIAAEINREYKTSGTPIKLFIGHSDPKVDQKDNPPIAGYGRGAYLGTFGPTKRLAIKTDAFYRPGYERAAAEYPERSPEFLPRTNGITGVALLKTDPRLKMGMLAFAKDEEVIYYGVGFVNERINYEGDMSDENEEMVPNDDMPEEDEGEEKSPADRGATGAGAAAPPPFQPHEIAFADRMMRHLEENHPAIKYLCGEHKKYMDSQAAMSQPSPAAPTAPSGTNGYLPGDTTKKPQPGERTDMASKERLDYAEMQNRIAALENENAVMYAREAIHSLQKQGKRIKDPQGEINTLVALPTMEARQNYLKHIQINYADEERSPARLQSWLPVEADHVEGAELQEVVAEPSTTEILRYAQDNNIDISDDAGLRQAMTGLMKKKTA